MAEGLPRSEAAREASRKNGRRSKGPVTRLGRPISSRNAFKHGLRARQTFDPMFLPAWLQAIEWRICSCFPYISVRRREYLDRVSSAMLRTQQAGRLITAELGRIMESVVALNLGVRDETDLNLAPLEQLNGSPTQEPKHPIARASSHPAYKSDRSGAPKFGGSSGVATSLGQRPDVSANTFSRPAVIC